MHNNDYLQSNNYLTLESEKGYWVAAATATSTRNEIAIFLGESLLLGEKLVFGLPLVGLKLLEVGLKLFGLPVLLVECSGLLTLRFHWS